MTDKKLYKGTFNFQGEVIEDWVRADTEQQAYRLLCVRLSVAKGRTASSIRNYFDGKPRSWSVERIEEK